MIRRFFFISAIFAGILASATSGAGTGPKIDLYLKGGRFLPKIRISANGKSQGIIAGIKAMSLSKEPTEKEFVPVFIKTEDTAYTRTRIEEAGGLVHTSHGGIITASVEAESIEALADDDEITFIEAAKPIQSKNDIARAELGVDEIHSGTNLPGSLTGRGVIVGVIDTGIDYTHPDFQNEEGRSRILAIWDQNRRGGPHPSEIENSFGTECNANSIASGSCPLRDFDGHGTHVAGTLAGRHDLYGGLAPDANIIVVSYDSTMDLGSGYAETIFSTKICQAAYYVFAKAEGLGLPAVVNLSLGTHIGAHDGTSLFEQCLAGLIKDSAGRAIVAAAGNENSNDPNYTGIHAGYDANGISATNFVIRRVSQDRIYYIDIWGSPAGDLSFGLAVHNGTPVRAPLKFSDLAGTGENISGTFLDGSVEYMINSSETASALNDKQHTGIRIILDESIEDPSKYSFDLIVSGKGRFDAWLFPDKPTKTIQFTSVSGNRGSDWNYVAGDRGGSIAIPATSPDIITVGAYTSRNTWDGGPGCCQVNYMLGELLDFSSVGPTPEPQSTGVKPEITAPGAMIASARSALSQPNELLLLGDGTHVLQAGTSMAAPFVSGTIALMFSANPNFTYEDARRYLLDSAYVDEAVDSTPNDSWGHGKLDVLKSIELATSNGASGNFDTNRALNTPASEDVGGGSGCQLITTGTVTGNPLWATVLFIIIAVSARTIFQRKHP